jgi:hypothetical protein
VPLSAEQGFEALLRKLDRGEAAQTNAGGARFLRPTRRRSADGSKVDSDPTFRRWPLAAAAAFVVAAVAAGVWLGARDDVEDNARYTTLSNDAPVEGAALDIVFASSTTEDAMRSLLNDIDATIVGGPTELGRYTVRLERRNAGDAQVDADVDALLERLARDPRVRFASRALLEEER